MPERPLSRREARWLEHFVNIGFEKMTYVPGKTLAIVDGQSRRPDYVKYTPREGLDDFLRENGVTDIPIYVGDRHIHLETEAVRLSLLETLQEINTMPATPRLTNHFSLTRNQTRMLEQYDNQDWKLKSTEFNIWQDKFGKFDVDACADELGKNAHCSDYWHLNKPCQLQS